MDTSNFANIVMQNKYNMLDTIFDAREEELAKLNRRDKDIIEKGNLEELHDEFKKAVSLILAKEEENANHILGLFEKYSDSTDVINAHFNKKYYCNRTKRWNKTNGRSN